MSSKSFFLSQQERRVLYNALERRVTAGGLNLFFLLSCCYLSSLTTSIGDEVP